MSGEKPPVTVRENVIYANFRSGRRDDTAQQKKPKRVSGQNAVAAWLRGYAKETSNSQSMATAKTLISTNRILSLDIHERYVEATVKGLYGHEADHYSVLMIFRPAEPEEEEEVVEILSDLPPSERVETIPVEVLKVLTIEGFFAVQARCTCPYRGDRMCSHVTAVALEVAREVEEDLSYGYMLFGLEPTILRTLVEKRVREKIEKAALNPTTKTPDAGATTGDPTVAEGTGAGASSGDSGAAAGDSGSDVAADSGAAGAGANGSGSAGAAGSDVAGADVVGTEASASKDASQPAPEGTPDESAGPWNAARAGAKFWEGGALPAIDVLYWRAPFDREDNSILFDAVRTVSRGQSEAMLGVEALQELSAAARARFTELVGPLPDQEEYWRNRAAVLSDDDYRTF